MKYTDVLYTPLDINSRPEIDQHVFTKWIKSVYPQNCVSINDVKKYTDHAKLGSDYPWNIVYGRFGGIWQDEFHHIFPKLAEYCYRGFGLYEQHIYSIIILPTRSHFTNKYFWHSDFDTTGLRFYLKNDSIESNHLLMRVNKPNTLHAWDMNASEMDMHVSSDIIKCKAYSSDQSFFINNIHAIHSPVNNVATDKITISVTIKSSAIESVIRNIVEPLVINSAYKYKDYSIFRSNP